MLSERIHREIAKLIIGEGTVSTEPIITVITEEVKEAKLEVVQRIRDAADRSVTTKYMTIFEELDRIEQEAGDE